MKSIEKLAEITTSDISDLLPIILEKVETSARPKLIADQFFKWSNRPAQTGDREVRIPIAGTVSASFVDEGSSLSGSEVESTLSYVTVYPKKIGAAVKITTETLRFKKVDILEMNLEEIGVAIAKKTNELLFNELLGLWDWSAGTYSLASNTETITGQGADATYTLSKSPIVKVISAIKTSDESAVTVSAVDYYDGKVKIADDLSGDNLRITYYYSTRGTYIDANTKGSLSYEDIVNAVVKLKASYYNPDVIIIPEANRADILTDNRFIDASAYGSSEPIRTGEVGKIAGLKVFFDATIENVALVLDTSYCARGYTFRELDMQEDRDILADVHKVVFWKEIGARVIRDDAICAIFNIASDASDL
ncbi:MAG: hypothetical protein DRJ18_01505 [Candidatus Methanomethylicota archaeon]|nr:MAG: hypothetical protein DRJ18_01505 [Candidatus Verstraetearchaeota archaeon]